ncbi:MAG: metallophosphoesterase family protein [Tannerellaceae bacterium]|jgi:predicted phosphodiesterase|nr:metallophosphoesterase family protein [Tannerellaceae bacterium]
MMRKIVWSLLAMSMFGCTNEQEAGLSFNKDGKFKIVQFTDIHYNTGSEGSAQAIQMMKRIVDAEKPDLVVYTGDVITCNPQKQGWDEVLDVVAERRIPYAVVLGNHDDEHDWTREQIFDHISAKPYSLARKGAGDIKGTGNYILKIAGNTKKTSALLYFFDSNAYSKVGEQQGYDWFGFDQVSWYRKNSREFTRANERIPYPALAFFHIPLHEYTLLRDTTKNYVKNTPFFGVREEKECPGILNTGMFAAMVEGGDVMSTFVGHDHDNDYIGCLNGICLAYGRCTGVRSTYNKIGFGARVIELKENSRTFETWIRDLQDQILHKVVYPDSFATQE